MTSTVSTGEVPPLSARETAGVFARHLAALYIPLNSLVFLWTGPHPWYVAPLFILPLVWIYRIDCSQRTERSQPIADRAAWPFDALVYVLAALQFALVVETARFFSVQSFFSLDMVLATLVLISGSSGFAIITAHELIHRSTRWEQQLGRLTLCTVLYEHFYTEHLRGHHVRVGTPEDPASARFGEGYESFFRRTVPAQFRSAWKLEKRRLDDPKSTLHAPKLLRNRILQGIVVEWAIAFSIFAAFGGAAFVVFLLQAFMAVRLLEAVNYFEHWGLTRRGPRVRTRDSWDTHSTFTYYGLIGLSRHADHHARPTRPYQRLRVVPDAPLLPYGYVGTIDMVMGYNEDFQTLAAVELARVGLGPFEPEEGAPAPATDADSVRERLERARESEANRGGANAAFGQAWRRVPILARRIVVYGGLLLAATAGAQWEMGAAEMGFSARLLLNAWILAALFLAVALGKLATVRFGAESVGWATGISALLILGMLTDLVV